MALKDLFSNKYSCYVVMADGETDISLTWKGDDAIQVCRQLEKIYPGAKRIRVQNKNGSEMVDISQ
jgi:hypothetical protein